MGIDIKLKIRLTELSTYLELTAESEVTQMSVRLLSSSTGGLERNGLCFDAASGRPSGSSVSSLRIVLRLQQNSLGGQPSHYEHDRGS